MINKALEAWSTYFTNDDQVRPEPMIISVSHQWSNSYCINDQVYSTRYPQPRNAFIYLDDVIRAKRPCFHYGTMIKWCEFWSIRRNAAYVVSNVARKSCLACSSWNDINSIIAISQHVSGCGTMIMYDDLVVQESAYFSSVVRSEKKIATDRPGSLGTPDIVRKLAVWIYRSG